MSKIIHKLKSLGENVPISIGAPLAHLPFALRLGPSYTLHRHAIRRYEKLSTAERDRWTLARLTQIVSLAQQNVPFYRNLYGASTGTIESFADFERLPIVSKADFQNSGNESRTWRSGMTVNTGGTSGEPLVFQVETNAFAREWAHMHHLWYRRGYRKHHLKLTFRGKHFDRSIPVRYNAVHNELVVNANADMEDVRDYVLAFNRVHIRWIHGYPSLVAEFANILDQADGAAKEQFLAGLHGVLLGSEYPADVYYQPIRRVLSSNVLSWYGHSEMAALAGMSAEGVYRSLPTYGYVEAVPAPTGGQFRLVCTSYSNLAHPFIRYDTGDIIEPVSTSSSGLAFRVVDGRIGDFITDRTGRRHSLTAIIFGRHHRAFERIQHIQVAQSQPGSALLLVTPKSGQETAEQIRRAFDLDDLDITWSIKLIPSAIRTQAGKISLKVPPTATPQD
ncbi:hypothetical protein AB6B38_03210 [Glycocaulis abyssi]|uniref:Phenylacetate-CoA ligase n=1 Tax=Glycocaulis abyssi TaxID=1433403 RepID=A0ABV9NIM5_9PROT